MQIGVSLAAMQVTNLVSLGASITLKNGSGVSLSASDLTYLHTATPAEDIKTLVVDDYTFFVNRSKQIAMTSDTSTDPDPAALLFCRAVRDAAVYRIKLWRDETSTGSPDYNVTYTAVAADDQGDVTSGLVSALNSASANTYFTYSNDGSLIHIKETDSSDFRVEIETSYTESFYSFKDSVQSLSLLPEEGYAGFIIKVENDADVSDDEYYVKYVSSNENITSGFTTGYWEETLAPGITYKIDNTTMPHVLISEGNNVFTFKPLDWGERIAGDETSNPDPSFVGEYIRGLLFYQNRLAFLTGENVVFSESGDYFNFFRTTVLQLLDSDPIDVALTSEDISLLNWGLSHSEQLIIFSDKAQFAITHGSEALTPTSIESRLVTKYSNFTNCRPQPLGRSIFFGYDKGDYSGVREYLVGSENLLFDADDISDQIPRYIEGDIEKLQAIDAENIIIAKATTSRNELYLYRYYDQGDTRVLSSWCKFDLGETDDATINDIFTIGNLLYIVITRNDGTYIEKADMSSGLKDENSEIVTSLDRRITDDDLSSATYSAITNLTTLTLPYEMHEDASPAVVTRTTVSLAGGINLNNVTRATATTLTVKGDYSSTPIWVGQSYEMSYSMTRPSIRTSSETGSGSVPIYNGRLQVRYLNLSLDNTQYLKVEVTPQYRNTYTYTYTPRLLGTGDTLVGGGLTQTDEVFRVPIYAKSREFSVTLYNNTPFQSNILGANWEGSYQIRSRTT